VIPPPHSIIIDSDVLIDYLNGVSTAKEILHSPLYRVYYTAVSRKELLGMPGLSTSEREKILRLLAKHRLIPIDQGIAKAFATLVAKYGGQGPRKADALVAATAWVKKLPLITRNIKHYHFVSEVTLVSPPELKSRS
jgi:predicted nucleic acid-binding protein